MLNRRMGKRLRNAIGVAAVVGGGCLMLGDSHVCAYEILGTGTGALIGGDLTDPENNGDELAYNPPTNLGNFDAIFDSSDEQGFGGGEFAFNVFDNVLGGGNDKWCCGMGGGISDDNPAWVSAELPGAYFLTGFTVSSANDTPDRDPTWWSIQGSNNGVDYTTIYEYDDFAPWDDRLQVIAWTAGEDFPEQTASYTHFRMATYNTNLNPSGAYFQIGEIEFFGTPDGVIPPRQVGDPGAVGQILFTGDRNNEMLGEVVSGVPGWSGRIVTFEEHGLTLDNHTVAEQALDDFEGETAIGAYDVVNMGGGGGTFPGADPYPNGVNNDSMNDFVVEVTADVVIPVGTYTIGFGSDDGGKLIIPGVEFLDYLNSDSFDEDQIRFEGNRGHGWTVGSFEVTDEPLVTQIVSSFHERGGGDSFEIAVIEGDLIEAADPNTGWELLGDGTLGWSVTTSAAPLVSADLSADARGGEREWQFDVDGATGDADQFVVENPDPSIYTTKLNVDGVPVLVTPLGTVANGQGFQIFDADVIEGTPVITSSVAGQNWVFDGATGRVCLTSCGDVLAGDYNNNGELDAGDLDLHAQYVKDGNLLGDVDGNGTVNVNDRNAWIHDYKNTWVGDADLNGEFNSSDFVAVFTAGKYESNEMAGWAEGDWNGDMVFTSGDFVAAFTDGGYELGPRQAVAAVPEPGTMSLFGLGLGWLASLLRRRR